MDLLSDLLTENIWVFFGFAILISFSGVMTPGPVFAATVAKGYEDEKAGIKIALGHGLIEFPLMAVIILSMGFIFTNEIVKSGIGLVGGGLLIFLGASMVRSRKMSSATKGQLFPYKSLTVGAITTSANPYFFLWWATVGALLITAALEYGAIIVFVFAVVHWSCDLAWYAFTSFAVFRTKHLWTPLVHEVVFGACGVLMIAFGVYFAIGPVSELL
ncbi:MAG: LysE family transporter [Methanobacteriota archaeon]|nr:MAG: LysE family transporter [Euryarchaeota archaeon]